MQKIFKVLVASVVAAALTWIPSFTCAPALAVDYAPGLMFTSIPKVEAQSGAIYSPGQTVGVYYDALRASSENDSCPPFSPKTQVTGHVMSDNSGIVKDFALKNLFGVDFVKVGSFETPQCYQESSVIELWFTGTGDGCVDSNFGKLYVFPVICD